MRQAQVADPVAEQHRRLADSLVGPSRVSCMPADTGRTTAGRRRVARKEDRQLTGTFTVTVRVTLPSRCHNRLICTASRLWPMLIAAAQIRRSARFGTAYRTKSSLTLCDGCACGDRRRLLATRAAHRPNRPRCAPTRTPLGQGCPGLPHRLNLDLPRRSPRPRPDQAKRPHGRLGRRNDRRLPGCRPRVRRLRQVRAPEAASRACRLLPAARRTSLAI